MAIKIGKYNFDGPFGNTANLKNQSGVYAILNNTGTNRNVIDIGESATVRDRVENHDRSDCWKRHGRTLEVAALYCSAHDRMRIEKELRLQFDPPCGKQ
jgi:hypothetical protein